LIHDPNPENRNNDCSSFLKERLPKSRPHDQADYSIWKTRGYYQYCLVQKAKLDGKKIQFDFSPLLELRTNELRTYSIPLASLDFIHDLSKRDLRRYEHAVTTIYLEANSRPGKEQEAAFDLCNVLRNSQADAESSFDCGLDSFRLASGIRDICLAKEVEVRLAGFLRNLWETRLNRGALLASKIA